MRLSAKTLLLLPYFVFAATAVGMVWSRVVLSPTYPAQPPQAVWGRQPLTNNNYYIYLK